MHPCPPHARPDLHGIICTFVSDRSVGGLASCYQRSTPKSEPFRPLWRGERFPDILDRATIQRIRTPTSGRCPPRIDSQARLIFIFNPHLMQSHPLRPVFSIDQRTHSILQSAAGGRTPHLLPF